jgi:hypothetical protein
MESKVRALEQACDDVQSGDADRMKRGERVLSEFHRIRAPYELCRVVLKSTRNAIARYHAVKALSGAALSHWRDLDTVQLIKIEKMLSSMLLAGYASSESSLVRRQLLASVAALLKRGWLEKRDAAMHLEHRTSFLQGLARMANDGSAAERQFFALEVLLAVLDEFEWTGGSHAGEQQQRRRTANNNENRVFGQDNNNGGGAASSSSSDPNVCVAPPKLDSDDDASAAAMSHEMHARALLGYQNDGCLLATLRVALKVLAQFVNRSDGSVACAGDGARRLFAVSLRLAMRALGWHFVRDEGAAKSWARKRVGDDRLAPVASVDEWRAAVVADGRLVRTLFAAHAHAATQPALANVAEAARQALMGVASASDALLGDLRTQHLQQFVAALGGALRSLAAAPADSVEPQCVLGFAQLCRKLLTYQPRAALLSRASSERFLSALGALTARCVAGGTQVERSWAVEAFEEFVDCWVAISMSAQSQAECAQVAKCSRLVFAHFVRAHLRNSAASCEQDDDPYEDPELLEEQMTAVGYLARNDPAHALGVLATPLRERVSTAHRLLEANFAMVRSDADRRRLLALQDELYFLLLVAGYVLTDAADGEDAEVPVPIERYSAACAPSDGADRVLALVALVGRAGAYNARCQKLMMAKQQRQQGASSSAAAAMPESAYSALVDRTTLWFLERWARAYVMRPPPPDERKRRARGLPPLVRSANLMRAYSMGDNVVPMVRSIVSRVVADLSHSSGDPELARQSCSLFRTLASTRGIAQLFVNCAAFEHMCKSMRESTNYLRQCPAKAKMLFVASLVQLAGAWPSADRARALFAICGDAFAHRLRHIVAHDDFAQSHARPSVRSELVHLVECMRGVAIACSARTFGPVHALCANVQAHMLRLLAVYRSSSALAPVLVVQLLKFLHDCVSVHLSYADDRAQFAVYAQFATGAIQVHSESAKRHLRQSPSAASTTTAAISSEDEVDAYRELLTLVKVLQAFADQLAFQPAAFEVVARGMYALIPLASESLLDFPKLAQQFYRVLRALFTERAIDRIAQFPDALRHALFAALERGMRHFNVAICRMSLESIGAVARRAAAAEPHPSLPAATMHFVKLLLHKSLFGDLNIHLTDAVADVLLPVIASKRSAFVGVVEPIVRAQRDPLHRERLGAAFNTLLAHKSIDWRAKPADIQPHFRALFRRFLTAVRGFCLSY